MKRAAHLWTCVLILSLLSACVPPTQTASYHGRVIDGDTHAPVAGAQVSMPGQDTPPAAADAQGVFTFTLPFAGDTFDAHIAVAASGYYTAEFDIPLRRDASAAMTVSLIRALTPDNSTYVPDPAQPPGSNPKGGVELRQLLVGKIGDSSRIEITARNPLPQPAFVEHLAIVASRKANIPCIVPAIAAHYTISDTLGLVSAANGALGGEGSVSETGGGPWYPVQASLSDDRCRGITLRLAFDTAFDLPPAIDSTIYITVPHALNLTGVETVEQPGKLLDIGDPKLFPNLAGVEHSYEQITVAAIVETQTISITRVSRLDLALDLVEQSGRLAAQGKAAAAEAKCAAALALQPDLAVACPPGGD